MHILFYFIAAKKNDVFYVPLAIIIMENHIIVKDPLRQIKSYRVHQIQATDTNDMRAINGMNN